jgi:hypothetical protein
MLCSYDTSGSSVERLSENLVVQTPLRTNASLLA